VISTPGHTPAHLCLWEPEHRLLAVGDALSSNDVGWVTSPSTAPTPPSPLTPAQHSPLPSDAPSVSSPTPPARSGTAHAASSPSPSRSAAASPPTRSRPTPSKRMDHRRSPTSQHHTRGPRRRTRPDHDRRWRHHHPRRPTLRHGRTHSRGARHVERPHAENLADGDV